MVVQTKTLKAEPELKAKYAVVSHMGAGFIKGEFGQEVFNEVLERAKKKYGNPDALNPERNTFTFEDEVGKGSNAFYVVLYNEVLAESGKRVQVATQADLENLLKAEDPLGIKGKFYVDTGLVLRSIEDPYEQNNQIAKDLYEEVKRRLGADFKFPILFWLRDLELIKADNPHGLSFRLKEGAIPIYVPILNQENSPVRFRSEDIDLGTGLPTRVGEGDRILYTRREGLSGLYLYRSLNANSDWDNLSNSDSDGRVVICGEAAQNEDAEARLLETRKKIEAQDKKARKDLELATRALRVLEGKE